MQRQKEFELAEFKMLHSEEGGERDQGGDRCVVLLDSGWEMLLGIMLRLQKLHTSIERCHCFSTST